MSKKSPLIKALRLLSKLLPGDFLRTAIYLNVIARPRHALNAYLCSFYRMDHVYDVLSEFKAKFKGNFSILEFGTGDGRAFTKILYATKYLGMDDRVIVHTFDSFEGLPAPLDEKDQDLFTTDRWVRGDFRGSHEELAAYCGRRYSNFRIHKGYFENTLTEEFMTCLKTHPPILVWLDCDYYSSARTVLERLVPYLPNGCVLYFDDYDINYGSRLTGESRLIYEVAQGLFGDGIDLVLDARLSLNSKRVYRFFRDASIIRYEPISKRDGALKVLRRTNDSPLP